MARHRFSTNYTRNSKPIRQYRIWKSLSLNSRQPENLCLSTTKFPQTDTATSRHIAVKISNYSCSKVTLTWKSSSMMLLHIAPPEPLTTSRTLPSSLPRPLNSSSLNFSDILIDWWMDGEDTLRMRMISCYKSFSSHLWTSLQNFKQIRPSCRKTQLKMMMMMMMIMKKKSKAMRAMMMTTTKMKTKKKPYMWLLVRSQKEKEKRKGKGKGKNKATHSPKCLRNHRRRQQLFLVTETINILIAPAPFRKTKRDPQIRSLLRPYAWTWRANRWILIFIIGIPSVPTRTTQLTRVTH